MEDQVSYLLSTGVKVAKINSNVEQRERERIFADLRSGHPKIRLLYVTPETATGEGFKRALSLVEKQRELKRIVVDEA